MQTLTWNDRVIQLAPTWAHVAEREVPEWQIADKALRSIAKRRAALDAEEAAWLIRARDAQVHRHLGLATFVAYLELVLGYGPRAAQERIRVAESLAVLPRIKKEMENGLSFSAARELTRVALPETEEKWLDATQGKNLREVEQMVSGHKPGDLPDSPPDPSLIEHVLHFEVSAQTSALFREAMRKLRQAAGRHLSEDEVLAQMARAALSGGGATADAPYQVGLTVCTGCKKTTMDGGGEPVEVGPEVLEKAMCDAVEIGRVDGDQPERARRTTPPAVRERVLHRDEMSNLITLCGACHDRLHDKTLVISGRAPDGLTFTWADGRSSGAADVGDRRVFDDAVSALVNLRFKKASAWSAVAEARAHVGARPKVEDLIRAALRVLRPPRVE
jgi:hypothetical protein